MPRILLVDDYPDALEVWSLYLKMCGFDVVTASNGAAALTAAAEHRPDAAILDLEMPGMSGYDLARRFRADVATAAMPLIAVSGHSQPSRIEEARSAGFDRVLTKPCDPDRLCLEIRQLLAVQERGAGVPPATVDWQGGSHNR
jgi:two-component system cell cycle response regulator DivK